MSGFTASKRLPIIKGDNKMEDLWCIENAGVEVEDFADVASEVEDAQRALEEAD